MPTATISPSSVRASCVGTGNRPTWNKTGNTAAQPYAAPPKAANRYFDADSDRPTAAWPAASRAVSTRKGEQLT